MGRLLQNGNRLIWTGDGETLQIEPWGANSLRVRATVLGELQDNRFSLLQPDEMLAHIEIIDGQATIRNGNIEAVIFAGNDWVPYARIRFQKPDGTVLLEEIEPQGALKLAARRFKSHLGGDWMIETCFQSDPQEKLYGMGQYQQEIMNLKNCMLELAHRNSQASIPFLLSDKGYGFLWHNPAVGRATFAANKTEWRAESTKQLDYWITAGETPAQIVESYAAATGYVPMMPEYGLGFWQCKLRYWNQEQLLEVARGYKQRNLPIDVIVCDFFHWPKMGDFRFDPEFFPDPQAMVDTLKEMGIELMVSVWPQIDLLSENFQEMRDLNLLVKPERGVNVCMQFVADNVFYDATNPAARAYVWEKCKKNYYDYGIKLFWLDEAEPEFGVYDYDNYRYHAGNSLQIGNIYPQAFSQTFYDGMREAGQDNVVNLVRCAWSGSQRYGALVWSGDIHSDFATMRKQICAGLQMGLSGMPWWTTDIGGFFGGNPQEDGFRELLIRWFQYGTFCPVMRLHGDRLPQETVYRKDGTKTLFSGADNEIWSYGEAAEEILSRLIHLRDKMRPYIRELMRQAHEHGTPVMRTLFYEFPQDKTGWLLQDEYLFGPDILVAPVVQPGATSRSVYLPEGANWVCATDRKAYAGGQTIEADAPLSVIPIFLRDGKQSELFQLLAK